MKDQETKEKFVEFRAKGWSYDRIAEELQVSKQTLINWSKAFELEIANLKAIELESLQEQFFMTHRKRIELLGELFKKLKDELNRRELADIPTDRLFHVFLKCLSYLKEESTGVYFREKEAFDLDLGTVKSWFG
jgi:hypothetical protein